MYKRDSEDTSEKDREWEGVYSTSSNHQDPFDVNDPNHLGGPVRILDGPYVYKGHGAEHDTSHRHSDPVKAARMDCLVCTIVTCLLCVGIGTTFIVILHE